MTTVVCLLYVLMYGQDICLSFFYYIKINLNIKNVQIMEIPKINSNIELKIEFTGSKYYNTNQ